MTPERLRGAENHLTIRHIRDEIAYRLREEDRLKLADIADILGWHQPSTAFDAINRHRHFLETGRYNGFKRTRRLGRPPKKAVN